MNLLSAAMFSPLIPISRGPMHHQMVNRLVMTSSHILAQSENGQGKYHQHAHKLVLKSIAAAKILPPLKQNTRRVLGQTKRLGTTLLDASPFPRKKSRSVLATPPKDNSPMPSKPTQQAFATTLIRCSLCRYGFKTDVR